jgi:predicted lysophospholipase L1 biosynthesis ABC-type transport system permease subunit
MLAVFCIAAGVMAIVSLQLAGLTVRHALTSDLREANGGDVSMQSFQAPLNRDDLAYLDQLKGQGLVRDWTPILTASVTARHEGSRPRPVNVQVVDPARYPLVGRLRFTSPRFGELRSLIGHTNQVVIDATAQNDLGVSVGDQIELVSQLAPLKVTVAGILAGGGGLTPVAQVMLSEETYKAATDTGPLYDGVNVTTPGHQQTVAAKAALQRHYPVATVRSTDDPLRSQEDSSRQIARFLDVVGLLALLVGGIGIANTMQVLLSRRRVEIAMLKTTGFRKRDLYVLFGLEAVWLGLAGGAAGAAAGTGLSFGVARLIENVLGQHLEPQLDRPSILAGVAVGVATAVTFGLLPIVKAAQVRPLAILRETAERGWRERFLSAALLGLLGLLFTALAFAVLRDVRLALFGVAGSLLGLGLLAAAFAVVGFAVGMIPVPERVRWVQALFWTPALLGSLAVTYFLPSVGVLMLLLAAAAWLVTITPSSWKATARLGLRGIGRQPTRTATTLVALFVGVFCVGLIVVLGIDIRGKLDEALSNQASYNLLAFQSVRGGDRVGPALSSLPGLQGERRYTTLSVSPVAVKNEQVADFASRVKSQQGADDQASWYSSVGSLEGSDLARGRLPEVALAADPAHPGRRAGRQLTQADAGTANVLGGEELLGAPWNLRPGDTLTLAEPRSHAMRTLTLVGFYTHTGFFNFQFGALKADSGLVGAWGGDDAAIVYSLKVDGARKLQAIDRLDSQAPAALVVDITDLGAIVDRILRNLLVLLTALASLALLAGGIIIANAVALAMLERRREIGIMKSMGFASRAVLAQVLFENALLGALSGSAAVVVVSLATALLGRFVFQTSLAVDLPLSIGIVAGSGLLAAVVAGVVAWAPTRVRPLEVLRYE